MASFFRCIFGPRLLKIYTTARTNSIDYVPTKPEHIGENILKMVSLTLKLSIYTSPIVVCILYWRDYFTPEGGHALMRNAILCTVLCTAAIIARAIGRSQNPAYLTFIDELRLTSDKNHPRAKEILSKYDFDFSAWPVEFQWKEVASDEKKSRLYIKPPSQCQSLLDYFQFFSGQLIGCLAAHSFGIRILYPGTVIKHFIEPHLVEGRRRFIEVHDGQRFKLIAQDGNSIDTMFVDRRGSSEFPNGDMLVICCEGNGGFYEVGMTPTPMEAGYSVMGWNHPGFAGSTGDPFPRQEQNAIDIVVQFALNKLNFPAERIILYGWSIGGFTASWAAMNYPNIRAVMLDATFDHVLPLALNVMPASWNSLVLATVHHHLNLAVAEQIVKYPGPVLLFRRTRDEVIALEPGELATNRGNDLLVALLKYRFPLIMDEPTLVVIRDWLNAEDRTNFERKYQVNFWACTQVMDSYAEKHSNSYPMTIGKDWTEKQKAQMALFLADRHMVDYDETHCAQLPADLFQCPRAFGDAEPEFEELSGFVEIKPGQL